jgi:hypothetical protein
MVTVRAMVFLTTFFNNISVISLCSVALVEGTRVPGETTGLPHFTYKLYHIKFYRVHLAMSEIRTCNFSGDMH